MKRFIIPILSVITFALSSCSDSKSYAEMLTDENQAVNVFLSQHRVIDEIPTENTVFEVGEDAPYYRLDPESNVYMQVLALGDQEKVEKDSKVYFRYTRYNLFYYVVGADNTLIGAGNADDMSSAALYFIYGNETISESTQYGTGIQLPLDYLGYNSRVNIVIKSQAGPTADLTYVIPYLYTISYYKPMI
ncbi:MAG: DUF4827 domain-containing protein [Duncaniella sp.]|nr:DUF4827 domain-containing protein [Duncaniella sp.]MDE6116142.1 DUF4827 domain-containing protein [Duncaniella sp.]MDE7145386.1 DUF4827 domain-containing protein [Duncaniella sp.]